MNAPLDAASDLRERAWQVMRAIAPRLEPSESEINAIVPVLAAIRAKAKAEGWDDAVRALREQYPDETEDLDCAVLDAADWLAANRPSPTGRGG